MKFAKVDDRLVASVSVDHSINSDHVQVACASLYVEKGTTTGIKRTDVILQVKAMCKEFGTYENWKKPNMAEVPRAQFLCDHLFPELIDK